MEVAIGGGAFYLEFEEVGCDSSFWLTKTVPGGKNPSKDNCWGGSFLSFFS